MNSTTAPTQGGPSDDGAAPAPARCVEGMSWEVETGSLQCRSVSDSAEEFLGFPAGRWIEEPGFWRERVHPGDRDRVVAALHASASSPRPIRFEHRLLAADGRVIEVEHTVCRVQSPPGPALLRGTLLARPRRPAALTPPPEPDGTEAAAHRALRTLAEAVPFIVWTADAEGRVDFLGRGFYQLTGLSPDKPPHAGWLECLHPEDAERAVSVWMQSVSHGTPYENEFRVRSSEGGWRWGRVSALPVRAPDGRVVRWHGVGVDIDDIRRLEADALRKAQQLHTVLQSITDGFFILDHDWRVALFSDEAGRLLDCRSQEVESHTLWAALPRLTGTTFRQGLEHAMAHRSTVTVEGHWDPSGRWLEMQAHPIDGGLAVALRDITAPRKTRERLRLQQAALEAAADSIAITDRDGILLWANTAYLNRYGYRHDELVGQKAGFLISSGQHDADYFRDLWATILTGRVWTGEIVNRHRDGHLVTEEMKITPLSVGGEAVTHFIAVKRDLTERRRAEEQLREQASLLDQTRDAIIVRDLDHRVRYWNRSAERIYGWSATEMIGRSARDQFYPDQAADFNERMRRLLADGHWSGPLTQKARDGALIEVESRWTLLRDAKGRPQSVLVVNTDVTERRRLERQVQHAQRLESIGTLAGGIAHELNNLFTPITMGAGLLQLGMPADQTAEIVRSIERSAQRGARLVKQMLAFARGTTGARVPLRPEHLVREIALLAASSFPKSIQVECLPAANTPPIEGDPVQLHQMLVNLALNARDAMPSGGRLTLSVGDRSIDDQHAATNPALPPGRYAVFEVADTGHGITPEHLPRIFDPYFTTKAVGEGTGMGLAVALGIARDHGGLIEVHSSPGHGAHFRVWLPAAQGTGSDPEPAATAGHADLRGRGELVLVVDDEASVLSVTRRTLESHGYRVLTAEEGARAIGLFAQQAGEIAAVITDLVMPVMDGPALIAALRRLRPDVPIVASSGFDAAGRVTSLAADGVKHFLTKPYTARRLLALLREVLEARPPSPPPGRTAEP